MLAPISDPPKLLFSDKKEEAIATNDKPQKTKKIIQL